MISKDENKFLTGNETLIFLIQKEHFSTVQFFNIITYVLSWSLQSEILIGSKHWIKSNGKETLQKVSIQANNNDFHNKHNIMH